MLTFKAAQLLRLCCCAIAAGSLPAMAAGFDDAPPSYRIGRPAPPERAGTLEFEVYRHTLELDRLRGWDMPGVLTTSLALRSGSGSAPLPLLPHGYRYTYQTHPMLTAAWGIPLGRRFAFEGFASYIAGGVPDDTGNESDDSNVEIQVMYDVGDAFGQGKNRFRIGVEYQFGDGAGTSNFGSPSAISSGRGFRTRTPVLRAEYHF